MLNFGNLLTAMVTPFDKELNVDYKKAQELALRLIEDKTTGLVVCGTTGEAPTLEKEEKLQLIKSIKEVAKDKNIPVVAGTGSYSTQEAIYLSQKAEQAGADALLVVNPYYNKPDQNGLYLHFKAVAESVSIPVILYNHPGRTGVCIETETLVKLTDIKNIVAIKDSSGNLELIGSFIRSVPSDFKVYSGDDAMNFFVYCLGGVGAISVASHVVGKQISEMFSLLDKGLLSDAKNIHHNLSDLFKVLFCAPSPSPTKEALRLVGFESGSVRLPLTDMNEDNAKKVKLVMDKLFK
jgi:4-hydroxy-tetrahydrodipicolinate synthase